MYKQDADTAAKEKRKKARIRYRMMQKYRPIFWIVGICCFLLLVIIVVATAADDNVRSTLLRQILGWPVLVFTLSIMMFGAFGRELMVLLQTRNIRVGNFFDIRGEVRDMEVTADNLLTDLEHRIRTLESTGSSSGKKTTPIAQPNDEALSPPNGQGISQTAAPPPLPAPTQEVNREQLSDDQRPNATNLTDMDKFERLTQSLANSRFEWRSLERLAIETGLTEEEVMRLFRDYGQGVVRMSKGKSGRRIAKLERGRR